MSARTDNPTRKENLATSLSARRDRDRDRDRDGELMADESRKWGGSCLTCYLQRVVMFLALMQGAWALSRWATATKSVHDVFPHGQYGQLAQSRLSALHSAESTRSLCLMQLAAPAAYAGGCLHTCPLPCSCGVVVLGRSAQFSQVPAGW